MGIHFLEGYCNDNAEKTSEALCLNDIAPITLLVDVSGVLSFLAESVDECLTDTERVTCVLLVSLRWYLIKLTVTLTGGRCTVLALRGRCEGFCGRHDSRRCDPPWVS